MQQKVNTSQSFSTEPYENDPPSGAVCQNEREMSDAPGHILVEGWGGDPCEPIP